MLYLNEGTISLRLDFEFSATCVFSPVFEIPVFEADYRSIWVNLGACLQTQLNMYIKSISCSCFMFTVEYSTHILNGPLAHPPTTNDFIIEFFYVYKIPHIFVTSAVLVCSLLRATSFV